jgi:hypothetical protein
MSWRGDGGSGGWVVTLLAADPLAGSQVPTHRTVPPYVSSSGDEVADLMEMAGTTLDPWQRQVLRDGLGERADGSWSAFEVAMILARQNGKNVVFEARELGGLFLLGERLIVHTAHQYKTSIEAFRRVDEIVTNYDWFRRKVRRVTRTNGEEGIELTSGARLRFLARSKASGRGFSANCLILDEAYELGDDEMSAMLPTLSAMPNPQIWYGSSAGMRTSVQLGRIWRRIMRAVASGVTDPSLAGFLWQASLCSVFCRKGCGEHDRIEDPAVWAKTNPALGVTHANGTGLTAGFIANELATMDGSAFARERLSVGDYPPDEAELWAVIGEDVWRSRSDERSQARGTVAFAVEVGPERRSAAICAAGLRGDGRLHVEVIEHEAGTDWVPARVAELWRRWRPCAVIVDPGSHAGALLGAIEQAGVEVALPFSARDAAAACSQFYDAVVQDDVRHMDQGALTAAVAGALTRPLSDAWAWDRKASAVDISPLVAASLAVWGFNKFGRRSEPPYDLLRSVG